MGVYGFEQKISSPYRDNPLKSAADFSLPELIIVEAILYRHC
jgi:hypothetical protein